MLLSDKRRRILAILEELLHVIIYADTQSLSSYEFYLETINLLLVLLSGQMIRGTSDACENDRIMHILLNDLSHFSKGMIGRLLENVIVRQSKPIGAAGVLYSVYSVFFAPKEDPSKISPLADKSMLLMLVVTGQSSSVSQNLFREAFASLVDSGSDSAPLILSDVSSNPLQMPFRSIYHAIIKHIHRDETCLLLYMLLLKNREFRMYVLSRTDPEGLMLPLLHLIYDVVEQKTSYSQLYILLTIILILSQDDVYNEGIHKMSITAPPWFTERIIRSVSLGGLTILVLIRVIQANLSRHRDLYFHTTCLAILANMSSTVANMHSVVAQRIIKSVTDISPNTRMHLICRLTAAPLYSLYESVAKKYLRLQRRSSIAPDEDSTAAVPEKPSVNAAADNAATADTDAELAVCSDIIALLLEIINSVLTHTLKSNPQLIYALLQRRDLFTPFHSHPRFHELIGNIELVISHFHSQFADSNLRSPTVDDILKLIDSTAKRWAASRVQRFPDVKFQYEEDVEYQRFFIPYVWSLVYRHSLIYWIIMQGLQDQVPTRQPVGQTLGVNWVAR
eukprot:jgi/Hompol1/2658/HPOL_005483-RA